MKIISKIKNSVSLAWFYFFKGMRAADLLMSTQQDNSSNVETNYQMHVGGVFSDLLQKKETDEVKELRDKYYRVLREADKYDTSNIIMSEREIINEKGEKETVIDFKQKGKLKKKTKIDFMKHCPVYEDGEIPLRTIQDNKHIQKHNNFVADKELWDTSLYNYDTTLNITRDDFMPRFQIEKFVTKIVVRKYDELDRGVVDLYLPTTASQFGKIDAMLIANINRIWQEHDLKSDITDFKTMEWYSDKAWNCEDLCLFSFDDIHFIGINIFDGSFVLSFDCHVVNNGTDMTEKYKTQELDEKYKYNAPKHDAIDIFTLKRHQENAKNDKDKIDLGNISEIKWK